MIGLSSAISLLLIILVLDSFRNILNTCKNHVSCASAHVPVNLLVYNPTYFQSQTKVLG